MNNWRKCLISETHTIRQAIETLANAGTDQQVCLVADDSGRLLGTVTDGDIRRGILAGLELAEPVGQIMNRAPKVAETGLGHADHIRMMATYHIHQLPLVDADRRIIGLKTLQTLVREETSRPNWVVLMAGGKGSRLRPLTNDTPKPLLCLDDKPILELILGAFCLQGFRKFYISVNYMAEQIERHFGDGARWGATIRYLREDEALGTAGPLGMIPDVPSEPLLVMNGDLLTTVHFDSLLQHHSDHGATATMAVREYDVQIPFGVVQIEDERIRGIDEKPVQSVHVNAGLYVLDPSVLHRVPKGRTFDMTDLFDGLVADGEKAVAFSLRDQWIDIGRAEDLDRARAVIQDMRSE